jgi:hypothetical protein
MPPATAPEAAKASDTANAVIFLCIDILPTFMSYPERTLERPSRRSLPPVRPSQVSPNCPRHRVSLAQTVPVRLWSIAAPDKPYDRSRPIKPVQRPGSSLWQAIHRDPQRSRSAGARCRSLSGMRHRSLAAGDYGTDSTKARDRRGAQARLTARRAPGPSAPMQARANSGATAGDWCEMRATLIGVAPRDRSDLCRP